MKKPAPKAKPTRKRPRKLGRIELKAEPWLANIEEDSRRQLRTTTAHFVLGALSVCTAATLTLLFLVAFGVCTLPHAFLHWLGGATVGQVGTYGYLLCKFLFK